MLTFSANAQEYCVQYGTTDREALMEPYRNLNFAPYSFCIKIYIHVVRKDDETGGQSPSDVEEALTFLDDAYNPYNIYFDWDNNIDYIDNTDKYDLPNGTIYTFNNHTDGIDIYLFDDSVGFLTSTGIGNANDAENSTELFVTGYFPSNNQVIYPLVRSHVLSHEMGHVLTLWHTHHGTVIENYDIDPGQCPELVDGSNGSECGDYIYDTPADPNMGYNVDLSTCEWIDTANSIYTPDELNLMSYTQPECMEYITYQQSKRIKAALASLPYLQAVSTYNYEDNPCDPSPSPFNFYPNSANQELNLDLTNKPLATYTYELYDNYGVLVTTGQSQNILKTIDTSTLPEGIYFLHFYENGLLTIEQIIVDH